MAHEPMIRAVILEAIRHAAGRTAAEVATWRRRCRKAHDVGLFVLHQLASLSCSLSIRARMHRRISLLREAQVREACCSSQAFMSAGRRSNTAIVCGLVIKEFPFRCISNIQTIPEAYQRSLGQPPLEVRLSATSTVLFFWSSE